MSWEQTMIQSRRQQQSGRTKRLRYSAFTTAFCRGPERSEGHFGSNAELDGTVQAGGSSSLACTTSPNPTILAGREMGSEGHDCIAREEQRAQKPRK
jgi:hypothetical protein